MRTLGIIGVKHLRIHAYIYAPHLRGGGHIVFGALPVNVDVGVSVGIGVGVSLSSLHNTL